MEEFLVKLITCRGAAVAQRTSVEKSKDKKLRKESESEDEC
jgi:hypothetical protein